MGFPDFNSSFPTSPYTSYSDTEPGSPSHCLGRTKQSSAVPRNLSRRALFGDSPPPISSSRRGALLGTSGNSSPVTIPKALFGFGSDSSPPLSPKFVGNAVEQVEKGQKRKREQVLRSSLFEGQVDLDSLEKELDSALESSSVVVAIADDFSHSREGIEELKIHLAQCASNATEDVWAVPPQSKQIDKTDVQATPGRETKEQDITDVQATPGKKPKERDTPYRKLYIAASEGEFELHNEKVRVSYLAQGDFMAVYTIEGNDRVVLKIYNEKKSNFLPKRLLGYLTNTLDNYRLVKDLVPCAIFYNLETAPSDCFLLQEKVPHPVNIHDKSQIEMVRRDYEISLARKIPLDLKPDNFRVREDGTVTLIDFVEDPAEGTALFAKHTLQMWCVEWKNAGCSLYSVSERLKVLTQGLDQFGYVMDYNYVILRNVFTEARAD